MLDNNDVALLKGMLRDNNEILRDEMRAFINASEKRVVTQIADLLHESVFPQIAQLQAKLA